MALFRLPLTAMFILLLVPSLTHAETGPHDSRADVAVSEQQAVDFKGFEFYPRGTGPRGQISFARFGFPVPVKKDEESGRDLICVRPGITPNQDQPSFGVSLSISF
jgi:hypothetical protein